VQRPGGYAFQGRPVSEASRLFVRAQQRLDLDAQRSIVAPAGADCGFVTGSKEKT
jgi:hypothetical protein